MAKNDEPEQPIIDPNFARVFLPVAFAVNRHMVYHLGRAPAARDRSPGRWIRQGARRQNTCLRPQPNRCGPARNRLPCRPITDDNKGDA